tara:strand:+ start:6170 stop:6703 length:534 start_codon:yes stop_codon:yes gene_type:complete
MEKVYADKIAIPVIIALSIIVPIVVVILMYMPVRFNLFNTDSGTLPFFHALLNGSTAILLTIGYFFMSVKAYKWHRNTMILAFLLSCVFLVSYVISKISNAPVAYGGEGVLRYIYFFILITHIVLSAIIIPLVLFTMYRGLSGQYKKHAKIARWTFPIWLYISITGVLVYVFMWPYY